ncbi:MAG: fibronectin type III domain-containing protein, partial [Candidatus Eisenbacteria bacterium]
LCTNGASWFGSANDCNSVFGSPMFQDSSSTSFDPHLRTGSAAIHAGAGGSDIGAISFGPDLIPPAAIADLDSSLVNDRDLVLRWTAPGSDGMAGQASAYDLRYSTSPITSGSFASATPVSPQPAPAGAGTPQSYVLQSLSPGARYYFAIKAVDGSGNWSAISNVLSLTMKTTDQMAPARVGDLGAN